MFIRISCLFNYLKVEHELDNLSQECVPGLLIPSPLSQSYPHPLSLRQQHVTMEGPPSELVGRGGGLGLTIAFTYPGAGGRKRKGNAGL